MRIRSGLVATAIVAVAAPLATTVMPAQAVTAPVTHVSTVTPWTPSGALRVKATVRKAGLDSVCNASNVTGRHGAYRCYVNNQILDPAFKSPTTNAVVYLSGNHWVEYKGVQHFAHTAAGASRIWRVQLANGATCIAATGAGPAALPKYPTWVGTCSGGPYDFAKLPIWRATANDGRNANYPMLATNTAHTRWSVPVEYPVGSGHVTMVSVVRAYR